MYTNRVEVHAEDAVVGRARDDVDRVRGGCHGEQHATHALLVGVHAESNVSRCRC